jgi:NAD(P)-dependent dehydrogenase (short-subunit alcohol dehydrogenase family)
MSHDRRRVAILGGSAGVGLATAQMLGARDVAVIIGGRDAQRLERAAPLVPGASKALAVDAADPASLRSFFEAAGHLDDLVVTVTGRGGAGPASGLAEQDLVSGFRAKPLAHLQAVALCLPTLHERGSITLVSAGSAQSALPGTAGLAALNGAIEAAIPALARELAPRRVNAVSPGVIDTGWWDGMPTADRERIFEEFANRAPLGRIGTANDVAAAIVALMDNSFITGVVLACDGGLRFT